MLDALQYIVSLVQISNKFDHISVGYVKKTTQKQPKIVTFYWYENIGNFKTRELQISHKLNLAQICISWTPLIYQNMRVPMNERVGTQPKNHQKMSWN